MFTPADNAHHRQPRQSLRAGWLAFCLVAAFALPDGVAARDVPPYRDIYTSANQGLRPYDIHAWVYPSRSASRFQMPEEWADDGLQGTLALAYRVEWLSGQTCGYEEEPACRQRVRCVLDAYFDQPSRLPFRNDLVANHDTFGGELSAHWLTPQNEEDFRAIEALRRSTTLGGGVALQYTDPDGSIRTIETNTFQYERRMYDLDQVSLQVPCTFPDRLEAIDAPIRIVIGEAEGDATDANGQPRVNRVITIPVGFLPRWQAHHREYMAWESAYHDTWVDAPWRQRTYAPGDYASRFAPGRNQRYDRDIHTWTYTRDFAERFGMPEQWIATESLGDAAALAFRVQRAVSGSCGAGFDSGNCQRWETCMWDVYLPADAPIPWYVDWPVSNLGGGIKENSIRFLQENDREKNRRTEAVYVQAKYIHGGNPEDVRAVTAPIGWQWQVKRYRNLMAGLGYWRERRWVGGIGHSLKTYDRRLLGFQLLSVVGSCKSRRSFEMRRSGSVMKYRDHRILFPPRGIDFVAFDHLMDVQRINKPDAVVEISLPKEFEFRWLDHQTSTFLSGRRIEKLLHVGSR